MRNADCVTGPPDMHGQHIVFGQIGDREARDQEPVEDPHERVPHVDLRRCDALFPLKHDLFSLRHDGNL